MDNIFKRNQPKALTIISKFITFIIRQVRYKTESIAYFYRLQAAVILTKGPLSK